MADRHELSVTVPDDLAEQVRARVATSEFACLSDVVAEALRTLEDRDRDLEHWLRSEVVAAYDKMKADPSRARSLEQVRASLAASTNEPSPRKARDHASRHPLPGGRGASRIDLSLHRRRRLSGVRSPLYRGDRAQVRRPCHIPSPRHTPRRPGQGRPHPRLPRSSDHRLFDRAGRSDDPRHLPRRPGLRGVPSKGVSRFAASRETKEGWARKAAKPRRIGSGATRPRAKWGQTPKTTIADFSGRLPIRKS